MRELSFLEQKVKILAAALEIGLNSGYTQGSSEVSLLNELLSEAQTEFAKIYPNYDKTLTSESQSLRMHNFLQTSTLLATQITTGDKITDNLRTEFKNKFQELRNVYPNSLGAEYKIKEEMLKVYSQLRDALHKGPTGLSEFSKVNSIDLNTAAYEAQYNADLVNKIMASEPKNMEEGYWRLAYLEDKIRELWPMQRYQGYTQSQIALSNAVEDCIHAIERQAAEGEEINADVKQKLQKALEDRRDTVGFFIECKLTLPFPSDTTQANQQLNDVQAFLEAVEKNDIRQALSLRSQVLKHFPYAKEKFDWRNKNVNMVKAIQEKNEQQIEDLVYNLQFSYQDEYLGNDESFYKKADALYIPMLQAVKSANLEYIIATLERDFNVAGLSQRRYDLYDVTVQPQVTIATPPTPKPQRPATSASGLASPTPEQIAQWKAAIADNPDSAAAYYPLLRADRAKGKQIFKEQMRAGVISPNTYHLVSSRIHELEVFGGKSAFEVDAGEEKIIGMLAVMKLRWDDVQKDARVGVIPYKEQDMYQQRVYFDLKAHLQESGIQVDANTLNNFSRQDINTFLEGIGLGQSNAQTAAAQVGANATWITQPQAPSYASNTPPPVNQVLAGDIISSFHDDSTNIIGKLSGVFKDTIASDQHFVSDLMRVQNAIENLIYDKVSLAHRLDDTLNTVDAYNQLRAKLEETLKRQYPEGNSNRQTALALLSTVNPFDQQAIPSCDQYQRKNIANTLNRAESFFAIAQTNIGMERANIMKEKAVNLVQNLKVDPNLGSHLTDELLVKFPQCQVSQGRGGGGPSRFIKQYHGGSLGM